MTTLTLSPEYECICTYKYTEPIYIFHVLSIFSCCLRPIYHSILLEISFCDTRVFWTNLACSERCWISIRKQVQFKPSWLEPFTLKPQRIFALTFWFSIKDGLGIFKQLINWHLVLLKKGHLQSHSSWCVRVNWEFRIGAVNSCRSWQIGIFVITLTFASIRERCLTRYHYPWNLVPGSFSLNYYRTVKWMKELIYPLFILDGMLPGCIQGVYKGHLKVLISPYNKDWWHYMPYIHYQDKCSYSRCLVCATVLNCAHSSSWEFGAEFKHI